MTTIYDYWGKAHQDGSHLLVYHSLDVAATATIYLNRNPLFLKEYGQLRDMLPFLMALHDLGKFSATFQLKRYDLVSNFYDTQDQKKFAHSSNHSIAGYKLFTNKINQAQYIYDHLPKLHSSEEDNIEIWTLLASIVIGHHGKPPARSNVTKVSLTSRSIPDSNYNEDNLNKIVEFIKLIDFLLPSSINFNMELSKLKSLSWIIAGFSTFCDWLGSNTTFFPYERATFKLPCYYELAKKKATEALDFYNLNDKKVCRGFSFSDFFNISHPSPLQQKVIDLPINSEQQLYLIEDLPGAGKTEAALYLSYKLMQSSEQRGVFFALPTQTTSNSMYQRFQKFFNNFYEGTPNLALTHQNASLNLEYNQYKSSLKDDCAEYDISNWFFDSNRKALLADLAIGTIDQSLISVLPIKFQNLRCFGLYKKVIIFDEFHCYNQYETILALSLMQYHMEHGGKCIVMSATLSDDKKKKIASLINKNDNYYSPSIEYPLLTVYSASCIEQVPLESRPELYRSISFNIESDHKACINSLVNAYKNGQAACWIRNIVDDARKTYEEILKVEGISPEDVILFHSRFALKDRMDIEKKVLSCFGKTSDHSNRNKIIIATQVIEQALDLDFDFMICDMAPVENILQRSGRYHRHTRDCNGNISPVEGRKLAPLIIYGPQVDKQPQANWYTVFFNKAATVYSEHFAIYSFSSFIDGRPTIEIPQDVRRIMDFSYNTSHHWSNCFNKNIKEYEKNVIVEGSLANYSKLKLHEGYVWDLTSWESETTPTTRLIEASIKVILYKDNQPLYKDNENNDRVSSLLSSFSFQQRSLYEFLLNTPEQLRVYNFDINKKSLIIHLDGNNHCEFSIGDKTIKFSYDSLKGMFYEKS